MATLMLRCWVGTLGQFSKMLFIKDRKNSHCEAQTVEPL